MEAHGEVGEIHNYGPLAIEIHDLEETHGQAMGLEETRLAVGLPRCFL
jgi:hypothetical protein